MRQQKYLLENQIQPIISIPKAHYNSIESIDANPLGNQLATASHDHLIKLWDSEKVVEKAKLQAHKQGVWTVSYSSDGKQLLTGSCDTNIIIWDLKRNKPVKILQGHQNKIYWAKFNQKNDQIASCGQESPVIIWDLRTGKIFKKINTKSMVTYCVEWSKNGQYLATTQMNGKLNLYDTKNFDLCASSEENRIAHQRSYGCDLDFVNMNHRIFIATQQKQIKQYQFINNHLNFKKKIFAHFDAVKSLTLNGKKELLISTGRDGSVRLWDVEQNIKNIATLIGHTDNVPKAVFIPNNDKCLIASGAWDQRLNIWSVNV